MLSLQTWGHQLLLDPTVGRSRKVQRGGLWGGRLGRQHSSAPGLETASGNIQCCPSVSGGTSLLLPGAGASLAEGSRNLSVCFCQQYRCAGLNTEICARGLDQRASLKSAHTEPVEIVPGLGLPTSSGLASSKADGKHWAGPSHPTPPGRGAAGEMLVLQLVRNKTPWRSCRN